MEGKG